MQRSPPVHLTLGKPPRGSLFEAGQFSSCLSGAKCIELHEPGTRRGGLQASSPFVNGSGPYIDKIITIATPYRGSLKAIEALLPGARNFFGLEAQKAMRRASRTLPGVYQLLPSWEKAAVDKHSGKHIDIFTQDVWQDNLVKTLAKEYGKTFFQAMLDDARAFTDVVKQDYNTDIRKRFYCVYGVGSETWKQVKVDPRNGNRFDFEKAAEDKRGDGTVHKLSSYVKAAGFFKDTKKFIELGGQHAQMPNHGAVQDYIVALFTKSKYLRPFESKP